MKIRFYPILLLLSALALSACTKHNFADGQLSPIIALSDLRALYVGADLTLTTDNMLGAHQVVGLVISNPDSGNVPQGQVILQNIRRGQVRGITLPLGTSASKYHSGDSLIIEVAGTTLAKVNGAMQLTGVTDASIKKISSGNKLTTRSVSSYSIKLNPGLYENTLVQIKTATVSPAPAFGDTYAGEKFLVNGADSVIMHTETTASFAMAKLPASATVTGIIFLTQNAIKIWPRTGADFTDKTAPIDPSTLGLGKSPVVIAGYINDTKGSDGNYEYFQFIATRTIDFSKNPMAVVTCTNAGTATPNAGDAPGAGWATGGGRTYKFNLTSGIVNKGDFFYVGGSNKKINGPNTTDLSTSKWIRAIAYVTNDGDGFGSASTGLLPNSGNAGGIAIFEGITVTEASVPVDAVFFGGTGKTTMYNATTNKGYRIPDNDHYKATDATGAAQPFMFQGTNTYIIPHSLPADAGIYVKLGGKFDSVNKVWIAPRGYLFDTLTSTSPLTEIEIASDVTVVQ